MWYAIIIKFIVVLIVALFLERVLRIKGNTSNPQNIVIIFVVFLALFYILDYFVK